MLCKRVHITTLSKALSLAPFSYFLTPIQSLLCLKVYCRKIQRLPNQHNTVCFSTSCVCLPLRKLSASGENGSRADCETTLLGCRALKPSNIFMFSAGLAQGIPSTSLNIFYSMSAHYLNNLPCFGFWIKMGKFRTGICYWGLHRRLQVYTLHGHRFSSETICNENTVQTMFYQGEAFSTEKIQKKTVLYGFFQ